MLETARKSIKDGLKLVLSDRLESRVASGVTDVTRTKGLVQRSPLHVDMVKKQFVQE